MRASWRRPVFAIAASLAVAIGSASLAGPAQAQPVQTGTLAFSGDPGDYISGGQKYSYSTDAGDSLNVSASSNHNTVAVSVDGANGDWWFLTLAAPQGQALAPGTYTGATRWPFQEPTEPGLDMSGNGRGCNMLTGSFAIENVTFGPNGYVQTLDATYEQHCEGAEPALRGDVHIANPPPPPALDFDIAVATSGTASTLNGNATVQGTVTCNKAADVNLNGTIRQTVKRVLVRGSYSLAVACTPGAPVPWTATASPSDLTPFQKGDAQVDTVATGRDSDYNQFVTVSDSTVVTLHKE
jgi:hypothetical protein